VTRSDPPRWIESEEAPEPLRRLLMASRAELGTPAQVDALAHELARVLGPVAGLGSLEQPASPSPTSLPPRGVVLRWLAPFGAATGVLALWWASNASRAPIASMASSPVSAPALSTPLASARSGSPVVAARDVTTAGSAADARAADPSDDSSAPHASAPDATAPDATAPHGTGTRASASRAIASHQRSAASAGEAALLEQARALLSRAPARALALTREHRRRFPHGALAEEREVITIEALKLLGRERAASDEADAFGTQYRNSVHRERLQQQPPSR
jgi:hypothetical protein